MASFIAEHAQTSFAGGEISPRLFGRFETELYKKALDYCENWEITPHGTMRHRGGTQLVGTLATPVPPVVSGFRAIPFRLSTGQDLVIVISDGTLQVWDASGQRKIYSTAVGGLTGAELVVNGNFTPSGGAGWAVVDLQPNAMWPVGGSFNWAGYAVLLCSVEVQISQVINIVQPGNYALKFHLEQVAGNGIQPLDIAVGSAPGGHDYMPNAQVRKISASGDYEIDLANVPAGNLYLTFTAEYVAPASPPPGYYRLSAISLKQLLAAPALVAPWGSAQLAGLQWAEDSANNRIVIVHGALPPQLLVVDASGYVAFGALGGPTPGTTVFANAPPEWTGTNWPSIAEISKGRLWLGATPGAPSHVWASRSGDYFDFSPYTITATGLPDHVNGWNVSIPGTDTVTANCAISEQLETRGRGAWFRGKQMLLMGTDLDEHAIFGNQGPLGPSNIDSTQESAWGSAPIQAINVGDQVLYVSRDTRKVRAVNYVHDEHAWLSKDVTLVAEHITAPGIKEIHFARDPNLTILSILTDGTWRCCTYDRLEQVTAWYRGTTQGTVLTGCVSHGPQGSNIWMVVQRANGIYLEMLPCNDLAPGYGYLDAAVTLPVPPASTQPAELIPAEPGVVIPQPAFTVGAENALFYVGGFGHLSGMSVQVILDGAIEGPQVVQNGIISLTRLGVSVTAGLVVGSAGQGPTATTLPPEVGRPGGGTSQRATRRWVKLVLRLNNSALPTVDGVQVTPDRSVATPMDAPEPLFTGDVEVDVSGYETAGEITITQPNPLRTEVCAIFGSLQSSEV